MAAGKLFQTRGAPKSYHFTGTRWYSTSRYSNEHQGFQLQPPKCNIKPQIRRWPFSGHTLEFQGDGLAHFRSSIPCLKNIAEYQILPRLLAARTLPIDSYPIQNLPSTKDIYASGISAKVQ